MKKTFDFLKELDESKNRVIYARITALTFEENPIEQIEGKITGGTLSIDGSSSLRRTCSSLSIVSSEINITDYYWGLNTKFNLEIGIKSEVTNDEIIWFQQGIFLITAFSTSYSTSNFNITISGQDKMCLLNGTIGGNISAPTDFGQEETVEYGYEPITFNEYSDYEANLYYIFQDGRYVKSMDEYKADKIYYLKTATTDIKKINVKTIIREVVHTYANENYGNIIINDLDDTGLELLEYRADSDMYFAFKDKDTCENIIVNSDMKCYIRGMKTPVAISTLKELGEKNHKNYLYNLVDGFNEDIEKISFDSSFEKAYYIASCGYGQTVGYRITDLTYPDDLTAQPGDTLTNAVLDKIVNMLGDYQYYYNVDGQFVFERKGTYLNTSWDSLIDTGDDVYAENATVVSKTIYSFEGNKLLSSISHNPTLNNIKNDFSVFGEREIGDKQKITIHARIAIDEKPDFYCSFDKILYKSKNCNDDIIFTNIKKTIICDWREVIYQMALDFYKNNQDDNFLINVRDNNLCKKNGEIFSPFPLGQTGYEQYYIDMQGFWRQLYNPEPEISYTFSGGKYQTIEVLIDNSDVTGAFEKKEVWVPSKQEYSTMTCDFLLPLSMKTNEEEPERNFTTDENLYYWNKNLLYNPELLNYWIDFLDTGGELGKYSIKAIGDRPKVVNDKDVNSIYHRETPNVIFFNNLDEYNQYSEEYKTGYTYVILPSNVKNMFSISAQGKSAKDSIDTLLYEHTYGQETISLQSIPIYYLEPNNRIYVYDKDSNINGDYLVSKMSIPLTYNGMMSIEAQKAPQRIY